MGLSDKLAAMRAGYLTRAEPRVAELLRRLDAPDVAPAALLTDIRIAVHDLSGTAPVLGFDGIGEAAAKAEVVTVEAMKAGDGASLDDLLPVRQAVAAVGEAVARAPRG